MHRRLCDEGQILGLELRFGSRAFWVAEREQEQTIDRNLDTWKTIRFPCTSSLIEATTNQHYVKAE